MTCNYCKGVEYEVVSEYTRLEKNKVLKCKNCGLVYLETQKSKKAIESFYSSEYRKVPELPLQSAQEHYDDKVTQYDAENRISFITDHIDVVDKRILEIGSAAGNLLTKLLEHGAKEVVGIELGEEFADYSRNKGFKVHTNSIEELDLSQEFDAVVSFHTLEHVFDPMSVIGSIYSSLKPSGVFLGEVPNQDDWRIKLFDNDLIKKFHYDPNHYYYFSSPTLNNYLNSWGFSDIQFETVERYNSLVQLRNILCINSKNIDVKEHLNRFIFPSSEETDVRLPNVQNEIEREFNRIFEIGVNSELVGNCLRWIAYKK